MKTSLLLLSLLVSSAALAKSSIRSHHGKEKLSLSVSLDKPSSELKLNGKVQLPRFVRVKHARGSLGRYEAKIEIDQSVVCEYAAKKGPFGQYLTNDYKLHFKGCSDGGNPKKVRAVEDLVELSVKGRTYLGRNSLIIKANFLVEDAVSETEGVTLEGVQAVEGQILQYNGDVWVAGDFPEGSKGEQGDVGPQGPAGVAGVAGVKGDKGDVGPQGPAGVAGVAGAKGDKGDKGDVGPQGPAGVAGVAGAKGDKGDVGPQGLAGIQGPQGEVGPAGKDATISLSSGVGIKGEIVDGSGEISVDVGTSPGQIAQVGVDGRLPASILPESTGASKVAFIKDLKPNGTHGGDCVAGSYVRRDLNSLNGDSTFVSISNNQIFLSPGTYRFNISAPGYLENIHKARLVNLTSGQTAIVGTAERSHTQYGGVSHSKIIGEVVISEASSFEVQHRCSNSRTLVGFGLAASFGEDEVYTQVQIEKVK